MRKFLYLCSVKKSQIVTVLLWLLSLSAIVYMVYQLAVYDDYAGLITSIQSADTLAWCSLMTLCILMPLQLLVEAWRWQTMLLGLAQVTIYQSLQQVLIGNMAGFITPYRVGDFPARLLQIGYTLPQWRQAIGGWRKWLIDWRKWLAVILQTLLRYLIWGIQLWAAFRFAGIVLTPLQAITSIAIYYFLISVMPSLPAADVAVKGGWAVVVFGKMTTNIPAIAIAVTLIWVINTLFPIIICFFQKIVVTLRSNSKSNAI